MRLNSLRKKKLLKTTLNFEVEKKEIKCKIGFVLLFQKIYTYNQVCGKCVYHTKSSTLSLN